LFIIINKENKDNIKNIEEEQKWTKNDLGENTIIDQNREKEKNKDNRNKLKNVVIIAESSYYFIYPFETAEFIRAIGGNMGT